MKGLFFVHGKSTAIPIREISKNWSPVCLRFFDGELPENDKVIVNAHFAECLLDIKGAEYCKCAPTKYRESKHPMRANI